MTEPPLPPSGYPPAGYPPPQPAGQAPSNYLVWSILVTIFCCIPFGIVAIVKSSQVNGLWAQGRYAEAQASADSAKKWVIWSVVVGLIVNAIIITVNLMNMNTNTNAAAMMFLGL
ncbi:MAG: CD225/dispanin family protein [Mycobacterium sp.]|uniref:CD225/dispanin family protein n=3 Tax=Mycobacterium sp. TaxID=1785 RepID=UPI003F9CD9FF